jgi:sugar O-acyltransferase (sialic acid O-acetyltransferase NeuD family)
LKKKIIIIGYSGHAYVILDIFNLLGYEVIGYCENEEKALNPFDLKYYGTEESVTGFSALSSNDWFICIGSNAIRQKIYTQLKSKGLNEPVNALHSTAYISKKAMLGYGVMISGQATVNPLAQIGTGTIINTNSVIEHECIIDEFVHIGPGAVLCGNVIIGNGSFVGANAVIKQGTVIGKNVIIGAGSVVIDDIPDNTVVVGNPSKILKNKSV